MNSQSEATKIRCQPRSTFDFCLPSGRGFLSHYSFELPATTNQARKSSYCPLHHNNFMRRFCVLIFSCKTCKHSVNSFMPSVLILFSCSKKGKSLATLPKRRPVESSDKTAHFNKLNSQFFYDFLRTSQGLQLDLPLAIRFGKLIAWLG